MSDLEQQLTLFHLNDEDDGDLSHSAHIIDAVPWVSNNGSRHNNLVDDREGTIHLHGKAGSYDFAVTPALIQIKKSDKYPDGRVAAFPGVREEIIEATLRKIAVDGGGIVVDGKYGVRFTLRHLQRLLKSMGHEYNLKQIKEGLEILAKTNLVISQRLPLRTKEKKRESSSWRDTIISDLRITTRAKYLTETNDAACFCAFHPMVSNSIAKGTYRLHDFTKRLTMRSPLARYIYLRMCHYYIQASQDDDKLYGFQLNSYIAQTPYSGADYVPAKRRAMEKALNCLQEPEYQIIEDWQGSPIRQGRKLMDVQYDITPTKQFVKFMILANTRHKKVKQHTEVLEAQ